MPIRVQLGFEGQDVPFPERKIKMSNLMKLKTAFIGLSFVAVAAMPALADSMIKVSLADKGGSMDLSVNMGLGMGMKGDMSKAIMSIETDVKTVPAGNRSKTRLWYCRTSPTKVVWMKRARMTWERSQSLIPENPALSRWI
jgi:hypothetical protein